MAGEMKTTFSSYIRVTTAVRLEEYLKKSGEAKTDVIDAALTKYLDEVEKK